MQQLQNFSSSSFSLTPVLAYTYHAPPLPRPPSEVSNHPFIHSLIRKHPDIFKIVTPLQVEWFEHYLTSHANRPLVESFCQGLHEGFWPFATHWSDFLLTHNESKNHPSLSSEALAFLYAQRDQEMALGQFSAVIPHTFKQGTFCMPIHAVPKTEPNKFCMITNHSAGKCALNLLISWEAITGRSPLDSLKHLADSL
ncbi:hypothetical protein BDQ17DRAFT_1261746, partial [Cyathus striatus]